MDCSRSPTSLYPSGRSPSVIIYLTWLEPTKTDGVLAKISHKPIRLDPFGKSVGGQTLVDTNFFSLSSHSSLVLDPFLAYHCSLPIFVTGTSLLAPRVDENAPRHVFSGG